jgi:hypothetical protein
MSHRHEDEKFEELADLVVFHWALAAAFNVAIIGLKLDLRCSLDAHDSVSMT